MPIKPENRARYPKDWLQIRARILARADNRCECTGQCGDRETTDVHRYSSNRVRVFSNGAERHRCGAPNGVYIARCTIDPTKYVTAEDVENGATAEHDTYAAIAHRVVLTVAHLDHTPENCADDNLIAMCQRCHLLYDKDEHAENARETRRSRKAVGELPW